MPNQLIRDYMSNCREKAIWHSESNQLSFCQSSYFFSRPIKIHWARPLLPMGYVECKTSVKWFFCSLKIKQEFHHLKNICDLTHLSNRFFLQSRSKSCHGFNNFCLATMRKHIFDSHRWLGWVRYKLKVQYFFVSLYEKNMKLKEKFWCQFLSPEFYGFIMIDTTRCRLLAKLLMESV